MLITYQFEIRSKGNPSPLGFEPRTVKCVDVVDENGRSLVGDDRKAIACNLVQGTSSCRTGALTYLVQLAAPRALVIVRSRSGRHIRRWDKLSNLKNFRRKNLPPTHPLYERVGEFADNVIESLRRVASERSDEC